MAWIHWTDNNGIITVPRNFVLGLGYALICSEWSYLRSLETNRLIRPWFSNFCIQSLRHNDETVWALSTFVRTLVLHNCSTLTIFINSIQCIQSIGEAIRCLCVCVRVFVCLLAVRLSNDCVRNSFPIFTKFSSSSDMWLARQLLFLRQAGSRYPILEVCKFQFWQFHESRLLTFLLLPRLYTDRHKNSGRVNINQCRLCNQSVVNETGNIMWKFRFRYRFHSFSNDKVRNPLPIFTKLCMRLGNMIADRLDAYYVWDKPEPEVDIQF